MADYSNPLGMVPTPQQMGGNMYQPMSLEGQIQADQLQSQSQPFIQQAQAGGYADLAQKLMQTKEFLSPEAQTARMSGFGAQTAQHEATEATAPVQAKRDVSNMLQEIKMNPYVTDQKISQAKLLTQQAQGSPFNDFYNQLGASYDAIHATKNPQQKAMLYQGVVQRWAQMHPGSPMPDQYKQFNPEIEGDMAAIRYSQLSSPEFLAKEKLARIAAGAQVESAGIHAAATTKAAETGAAASRYGASQATERTQMLENPQRAVVRLRGQLQQNPKDEATRQELEGTLTPMFETNFQKDPAANMMAIHANTPEGLTAYQAYKTWQRMEYMHRNGIPYVINGYVYTGGDPNKQSSWKKGGQ